jgi:hypothetical protein
MQIERVDTGKKLPTFAALVAHGSESSGLVKEAKDRGQDQGGQADQGNDQRGAFG